MEQNEKQDQPLKPAEAAPKKRSKIFIIILQAIIRCYAKNLFPFFTNSENAHSYILYLPCKSKWI